MVQVSLRDSDRRDEGGHDVGVLMCNLGAHLPDPAARLDTVRACMREGKQALSAMSGAQVLAMSTLGAGPDVASMLAQREGASTVRPDHLRRAGTAEPAELEQRRLDAVYPLSIPFDG